MPALKRSKTHYWECWLDPGHHECAIVHIRELEDILDELKRKEVKIDRDKRPIYRREVELLDIVRSSPKTIQQIMKEYGTTRTHIYRVFARLRRKGYNIRMVGKGYEVTE